MTAELNSMLFCFAIEKVLVSSWLPKQVRTTSAFNDHCND
jgi:hypothetical protein